METSDDSVNESVRVHQLALMVIVNADKCHTRAVLPMGQLIGQLRPLSVDLFCSAAMQ